MSILTRLSGIMPGFRNALAARIAVETPAERAARLIASAKAILEHSRGRPAPSTSEKVPSNYHGGVAGKIWFLPFWDSTTHDSPEIRAAMRLMRRDGYVKAAWEPQILTVASEDWQVQASEPGNRESEEQSDFVKSVIEDYFSGGMPQLVRAICAALGSDGHTLSEKVWDYAAKGRLQGKIICRAAKTKDTSESGFGVVRLEGDRYGNVQTVQSRRTSERFPIEDFLYARYMPVFDEPLGEAAYRPAYGAYWMRDTVRKLRMIHHEKKMAGMLVGEYESDEDKGPLETALAKAKTATWMSIPANTRLQAIALSTATEPDYKSFDESLRDEIVMAIAFAILQQLVGGNAGDVRGNAEVQKKISDLGPWLLMSIVMDVVNTQLIPDLIDFNFPYVAGSGYPKLTFGAVSNPELLELIQVVQGAQAIGLKPSRKHYAAALSIKEADPNDPGDQMTPEPAANRTAAASPTFSFADRPSDPGPPSPSPRPGNWGHSERVTATEIRQALTRFAEEVAA